jgi:hypothetical protein
MGLIVRILLIAGGFVASWLVARDALHFPVLSFIAALILFVGLAAILAFWPTIVRVFRELLGMNKPK